ncbi:GtrA family protein [Cupriavidus pinatubonensis]|uniref:GtrA family protein n=1 Tax=Cupriavidus pinatubonensis TaxID=248026 RepID=UPI001C72B636|nr:GtrA family protein [Cupriavidus pinatubonensis]QYY30220.1 GtrA family protein [Cupriavidus pinatubonensis]
MKTAFRFLIAGSLASGVNWLSRWGLSLLMPFTLAVIVAYMIGMVFGFFLYRNWAFPPTDRHAHTQVLPFVLTNAVGLLSVVATAVIFAHMLTAMGVVDRAMAENIGHFGAICIGAVVNFFGHRLVTFAS